MIWENQNLKYLILYSALYTKFHQHQSLGSGEDFFKCFLQLMGMVAILYMDINRLCMRQIKIPTLVLQRNFPIQMHKKTNLTFLLKDQKST